MNNKSDGAKQFLKFLGIGYLNALVYYLSYSLLVWLGVHYIVSNAVAALEKYPAPIIMIDMGTATIISYISEKRCYEGGLMFPGVRLSLMKLMGGTTLEKMAPLTPWMSQPYSVNRFIRSMLI